MTARSVWTALEDRFPAPAWAYFSEVRNGTGFSRRVTRTADALAFSLYPSRGLELHGIEVKVHRSDWLREKDDPEKAEAIAAFCNRWWLVTTEGCVKDASEIPPAWGWLDFDGKKLVQKKAAPLKEAKPLDLPMVAAILRKASDAHCALVSQALNAQLEDRIGTERASAREKEAELNKEISEGRDETRRAHALLHHLERDLGTSLFTEDYPKRPLVQLSEDLQERLRLARGADLEQLRATLQLAAHQLKDAATKARWLLRKSGIRPEKARRFRGAA